MAAPSPSKAQKLAQRQATIDSAQAANVAAYWSTSGIVTIPLG